MTTKASSCECTGGCESSAEPIVCTLAGRQEQELRAAEFRAVFAHLIRTQLFEGSFRWHFVGDQALERRLRSLAQRENECCRFFEFRITQEGGALIWETHAPPAARAVLEAFMRLPETLRSSEDSTTTMMRALADSGLKIVEGRE